MGKRVFATFEYEDDFIAALRRVHQEGYRQLTTMSPVPMHAVDEILQKPKSVVRRFTFFGALFGAMGGFALATFSALSFIQPSGGRAIIAFPPFLIISYEMAILLGVLATLVGFYIASGLPAWRDDTYDPVTSVDRFGIIIDCEGEDDAARVEALMRENGAEEIRHPEEEAEATDAGAQAEEQKA